MEEHSKTVGGSSAARIIKCPGSYLLSQQAPPPPDSPYAAEGTFLHDVMYKILTDELSAEDCIGHTDGEFTLTHDLYNEMIVPALRHLDELTELYGAFDFEPEARVHFPTIPGSFGTADLVAISRSTSLVIDYKFGRGVPVSAYRNAQLMYYAAAARGSDHTRDLMRRSRIVLAIIQPAVEPGLAVYETTHAELDRFEKDLGQAWAEAEQPNAGYAQGPHCRFCPAKIICPEIRKGVDLALTRCENDVKIPELGELLPLADRLEAWIREVRKAAHAELERGGQVPGYKLVAKRATRKWLDEAAAARALTGCRLRKEEIYDTSLISPAKAEKLVKNLGLKWDNIADKHVSAVSSGTTMAVADDPRQAIEVGSRAGKDLGL